MFKRGVDLVFSSLILSLLSAILLVTVTGFTWKDFRHVEQKRFHGQILNLTNQPLSFIHTDGRDVIPPGQNSMDTGVLDADGLIIDHPILVGDTTYTHGTFIVCDFGKLTLRSTPEGDVLEESPGTWLCRMLNDYGFSPSVEEALWK